MTFGANAGTVTAVNDGAVTVTVPAGVAGAVSVTVTTGAGNFDGLTYTYVAAPGALTLDPTSGSITGAPKVRAMEIIDEIEPTSRGAYTGSIGWIGLNGNASLNIAIRTIIIRDRKAYVQTGGGIVADSEPQSEWQETLIKAKALLAGIQAINES